MKLPNLEKTAVSQEKITGYLLSITHRDGKHKAAFFLGFGFKPEAWQELALATQPGIAVRTPAAEMTLRYL